MLDINLIRDEPEKFKKACQAKRVNPNLVDKVLDFDKRRRILIQKIEELRQGRKKLAETQRQKAKAIKKELKELEPKLKKIENEYLSFLYQIPNPPALDVKIGKSENENEILKYWKKPKQFDFSPLDHFSLGEKLDLLDSKKGAYTSGSRFAYIKNELVLLQFALLEYSFQILRKNNFTLLLPPLLIKSQIMKAMGYLEHGGEKETYYLPKDDLYLIATSEHVLGPYHSQEILLEDKFPLRYTAFSSCFRREAGAYGKDTRGIFRMHQFDKLEMFSFSLAEKSDKEHYFLLDLQEKLVQNLDLPYRVIKMCSADLGLPAARKYDIEVWFPGQNKYRETHSASNCADFQARRLNIKVRRKNGQLEFVHTLNATFFSQRLLLAIMENYQQSDGSIEIPKVLQNYMGQKVIKRS